MRMWVIVQELKIIKSKIKNILHLRVQFHGGQGSWVTPQLQFHLLHVVVVDMGITKGVYKIPRLVAAYLGHH